MNKEGMGGEASFSARISRPVELTSGIKLGKIIKDHSH